MYFPTNSLYLFPVLLYRTNHNMGLIWPLEASILANILQKSNYIGHLSRLEYQNTRGSI